MNPNSHKSGFVNIIGRPNVGKSTLMNALVGERMSIITSKPQTTRHRIIGIISDDDFQIIFSDTPGYVRDPAYKMHRAMNRFIYSTFEDADLLLFVTDVFEKYDEDDPLIGRLREAGIPKFLVVNKIDLADNEKVDSIVNGWQEKLSFDGFFPISALNKTGTEELLVNIIDGIPEGPVYYPKDQLTDRPERFFISEIIREKILMNYRQEIPYSCEVSVESFKEDEKDGKPLVRILAMIFVARKTHKAIVIGRKGEAIKQVGIEARKDIERFIEKKVYLELRVKVREGWRDDDRYLKSFGYKR